jgi:hypothetical protein
LTQVNALTLSAGKVRRSDSDEADVNSWRLAAVALVLVGVFVVLNEHWRHILGWLPYLLLLACPLLHLMHRGHGGHGGGRH